MQYFLYTVIQENLGITALFIVSTKIRILQYILIPEFVRIIQW